VGRDAAKFDVDELVDLLAELLPDELLPDVLLDDPVLVALLRVLVTDGLVMVPVEEPDTLDDDPVPVMESEEESPVSEEEGEVSVAVVGILPVMSKPQFFSTNEWNL
jgi:hypothetical protein